MKGYTFKARFPTITSACRQACPPPLVQTAQFKIAATILENMALSFNSRFVSFGPTWQTHDHLDAQRKVYCLHFGQLYENQAGEAGPTLFQGGILLVEQTPLVWLHQKHEAFAPLILVLPPLEHCSDS